MRSTYLSITALALVALVMVSYAFMTAGSPVERRDKKFDSERAAVMGYLIMYIDNFYTSNMRLPASYDELKGGTDSYLADYIDKYMYDPETGEPFEYIPGADTFQVCGVFSADYSAEESSSSYYSSYDKIEYKKGRYCHTYQVTASI